MKKRITAALLSVVLCLALLGTTALGADAKVTVSAKAGETQATVTATGLTPNTTYPMCALGSGDELLALFEVKTDSAGGFNVTVSTGTLTKGQTLKVIIPDPADEAVKTTGTGAVQEGTTPPTPTPPPGPDGGGDGGSSGSSGGGSSSSSKAPDVSKNKGGSVKVSSDGKTVTITPDEGYRVKDVIINGKSVGPVTKYVFDKASKNNTVQVYFEKIDDETQPAVTVDRFTDVSGHWAKSAISFVVEQGLFNGVSDTRFAPDDTMTRAMLVTVLHRLEGEPASGTAVFPDVPAGQWYTQAVAWAAGQGIVQGTGSGFEPNGNITREQLAAILYRYAGLKGLDTAARGDLSAFPDGGVSAWANEAMSWSVGAGILSGNDAGGLNPTGNATRAEVATMLMRFVNLMG